MAGRKVLPMTTITVPVDTLIHTDAHPYCEDSTCPCQGAERAAAVDLTGYEFAPRTIRHRQGGQDIQITEKPWKYGIRCKLTLKGVPLTGTQLHELERALMLWKYGIKEVPPEQASPFAQALGIPEYVSM